MLWGLLGESSKINSKRKAETLSLPRFMPFPIRPDAQRENNCSCLIDGMEKKTVCHYHSKRQEFCVYRRGICGGAIRRWRHFHSDTHDNPGAVLNKPATEFMTLSGTQERGVLMVSTMRGTVQQQARVTHACSSCTSLRRFLGFRLTCC